jgi:hypothetical protein
MDPTMQIEQATLPTRDRHSLPSPPLRRAPAIVPPDVASRAPVQERTAASEHAPKRRGQPFRDAEACIFWMIRRLAEEAEGASRRETSICTPIEVVKCLDTLYRRRRIDLHHVRILRLWAHRGRAPDRADPMERADWRVWREALERLEWPLRSLGIIS